jgi:hypothetical protein
MIKKNNNYTNPSISSIGARHYRHHSRMSLQLSSVNAIAQPPQHSFNLSAGAKRLKHSRIDISVVNLEIVAQMLYP